MKTRVLPSVEVKLREMARKGAEKELGRSVISKKNYLGKNVKKELEE